MNWAALLTAIVMVENTPKDPNAVSNRGAVGLYQIRECVVQDVNKIYKTHYVFPDDCRNECYARDICYKYLKYWADYLDYDSAEKISTIWYCGPTGSKKFNNDAKSYWEKVAPYYKQFSANDGTKKGR